MDLSKALPIVKEVSELLNGSTSMEEIIDRLQVKSKRDYKMFIGGIASAKNQSDDLQCAHYVNEQLINICKELMSKQQLMVMQRKLDKLKAVLELEADELIERIRKQRREATD